MRYLSHTEPNQTISCSMFYLLSRKQREMSCVRPIEKLLDNKYSPVDSTPVTMQVAWPCLSLTSSAVRVEQNTECKLKQIVP